VCSKTRFLQKHAKTLNKDNPPQQEIAQVHKLAVVRVFHIDNTPAVLASTHRHVVNNHVALRANNSEGDDMLPNKDLVNIHK
jgi:hypothetical protein